MMIMMLKMTNELQRDKKHLEECLAEVKEQEEEMSRANRALTTRLEDLQVGDIDRVFPFVMCSMAAKLWL